MLESKGVMEKISVIIPMYNSEAYIGQCLHSVRNQTYSNLEILVVDDGSTDKSLPICQELRVKDSRICLLTQEHGGVSKARNRGLDAATGKYLFFLDSDDMIHPFLLEELVKQMESKGTDLIFCICRRLNGKEIEEVYYKESVSVSKEKENSGIVEEKSGAFYYRYWRILTGIGGKLIRKDAVGELRFQPEVINGEDTLFLYELLCQQIRIACYDHPWYYYRIRSDSLSRTIQSTRTVY